MLGESFLSSGGTLHVLSEMIFNEMQKFRGEG